MTNRSEMTSDEKLAEKRETEAAWVGMARAGARVVAVTVVATITVATLTLAWVKITEVVAEARLVAKAEASLLAAQADLAAVEEASDEAVMAARTTRELSEKAFKSWLNSGKTEVKRLEVLPLVEAVEAAHAAALKADTAARDALLKGVIVLQEMLELQRLKGEPVTAERAEGD